MLEKERLTRHEVYVLPHEHGTWSKEHREAAEKVMRVFDLYGFLDSNGFVSRNLLVNLYTYPAVKIWNKVEGYVQAERISRSQPGHMHELQELATRAQQIIDARRKD